MTSTTTTRNEALDRLALGSMCPRCHAGADEQCRTRRASRATAPHAERIDRAVAQYQAARGQA